jgi:ceramide glucosyltransferase
VPTSVFGGITLAAAGISLLYVAACLAVTIKWRLGRRAAPLFSEPPVSVLKPICGLEPGLDDNLRSICRQSYPVVELLIGAASADDPALDVARRVAEEFPDQAIQIVAGAPRLGANRKIDTLAHLASIALYDVFVIADSDVRVGPQYLRSVTGELADPSVGIVSCLYRARPTGGAWSRFGALAIDEWFIPSVLISRALGSEAYCSGTTMALRRDVLDAAGGFQVLAPLLADDYELGARVRRLGLRSVIARHEVAATVHEESLGSLVAHELRWMRTVRTVSPLGHAMSWVTYCLPVALLAVIANSFKPWTFGLVALALLLRVALHYAVLLPTEDIEQADSTRRRTVWFVPLRDLMSFGVWMLSYASRRVTWRGKTMWVRPDGVLHPSEEGSPA